MMLGQGAPRDHYISIVRISPFNLPDASRRYVVIKAYYDGSGKSDSVSRLLTLGGFSGTEDAWGEFIPRWREILDSAGARHWHTVDAMHCRNEFDRSDWDSDRAVTVLNKIVDLICDVANFRLPHEKRLRSHVATVYLDDYRHTKAENKYLRSPEAICVNAAVGPVLEGPPGILLYFDRNEEFKRELHRVWERGRADKDTIQREWAMKVEAVCDLWAERYYELQLADALSWVVNRSHHLRLTGAPEAMANLATQRVARILGSASPDYTVFDAGKLMALQEEPR